MEGRGPTAQGRANVFDKKIPSPRSGEGGPKGRMGSLPPLELSTSKMKRPDGVSATPRTFNKQPA